MIELIIGFVGGWIIRALLEDKIKNLSKR